MTLPTAEGLPLAPLVRCFLLNDSQIMIQIYWLTMMTTRTIIAAIINTNTTPLTSDLQVHIEIDWALVCLARCSIAF